MCPRATMPVVLYECVPAINSFAPAPAKITEFGISFGTWGLGFGSPYTYSCVTITLGFENLFRRIHNCDAPWTPANFDPLQFFACLHIDNRDIVRRAIRRVKLRSIWAKRDSPGAVPNRNGCRDCILFRIDDRNGICATC